MYTIQKQPGFWQRRRNQVLIAGIALIFAAGAGTYLSRDQAIKPAVSSNVAKPKPHQITKRDDAISMVLTGDWIAHDSVNAAAQNSDGTYNYLPLVEPLAPLFKKTDIRFCNDPILNGGKALGISGYPKFNSPTEFVTDMGKYGCNLVNTASNHSFDFTQANIDASVAAWAAVPTTLAVAGQNRNQAEHDAVHMFTTKGLKFAFLAYTTYSNAAPQNSYGVSVYSPALAAQQIQAAKAQGAQIIIVSMRWGVEYSSQVTAAQEKAAQYLSDQGVNLVLGHGPHVLQPVQDLTGAAGNKTLVWYSLGNYLNTQIPPETLFNGVALLKINPATLAISITGYLPFHMQYEWTAAQAKAENTNARTKVKLELLEKTTQAAIDAQQINTTAKDQAARLVKTLNERGQQIPLLSSEQAGL